MYEVKEAPNLFYIGDTLETKVAYLSYSVEKMILTILHTEVTESLTGQGIAGKLVDYTVEFARKNDLLIVSVCSYASARFARKPEYNDVNFSMVSNK